MNKLIITFALAALAFGAVAGETDGARGRERRQPNPEAKLHRFSTTVEKKRPKLNQETKDLIATYRRDPSDANRAALRRQVAANYDAVVARKKAKLEDLKRTAKHRSKVEEMQVIVDEMLRDRESRIEASMARFTDPRFRPGLRDGMAVDAFGKTKGVCGGVDFWGNCWEWTATRRGSGYAVKGGAFDSRRTDCRTEARSEARAERQGYPNVTFRVVREDR